MLRVRMSVTSMLQIKATLRTGNAKLGGVLEYRKGVQERCCYWDKRDAETAGHSAIEATDKIDKCKEIQIGGCYYKDSDRTCCAAIKWNTSSKAARERSKPHAIETYVRATVQVACICQRIIYREQTHHPVC